MKKIARYLLARERIVWDFKWQDEPEFAYVAADSDWGGPLKTENPPREESGCWGDIA